MISWDINFMVSWDINFMISWDINFMRSCGYEFIYEFKTFKVFISLLYMFVNSFIKSCVKC